MATVEHLRTLYSHHFDVLARLMALAEDLSDDAYHEHPGYGRGSLHDLAFHILSTDRSWRLGLESGRRPEPLDPKDYPGRPALREFRRQERSAWQNLLADLTSTDLEESVALTAGADRVYEVPIWKIVHHVLLHGMQHLAEMAQLLTEKGHSPGDLDFIFYSQ